jgi:NAD(P) transhydrogenase subunit alpha
LILGIPREVHPGEKRVALVPESVRSLASDEIEVRVEAGAGEGAHTPDAEFEAAGARIESDAARLYGEADCLVKVREPENHPGTGRHEVDMLREGAALVALLNPLSGSDTASRLAARGVTSFALELMPRTTLAQSMDVLSSMSTISGYQAAVIAAEALPRLMPMMMTAAGTITPARVLVIGAGVAGLQAIATARRLGAVVEAFDIRPAAKEQVESLGARFVEEEALSAEAEDEGGYARAQSEDEARRTQELLGRRVGDSDIVICTALVPGRRAPVLVLEEHVKAMRPGSVIIDLAAEAGGNCALTKPGEVTHPHDVEIHGPLELPSTVSIHASQMFSRNVTNYLRHLIKDGDLRIDLEDELVRGPLVTHQGEIVNERVRQIREG